MIALELTGMLAFVLMMLMYSLEIKAFFIYLKEKHNDEYLLLNSPKWNFQLGDPTLRLAMKYIKKKGYLHLNDKALEDIHVKMKLFYRLALISAVVTLVSAYYAG